MNSPKKKPLTSCRQCKPHMREYPAATVAAFHLNRAEIGRRSSWSHRETLPLSVISTGSSHSLFAFSFILRITITTIGSTVKLHDANAFHQPAVPVIFVKAARTSAAFAYKINAVPLISRGHQKASFGGIFAGKSTALLR